MTSRRRGAGVGAVRVSCEDGISGGRIDSAPRRVYPQIMIERKAFGNTFHNSSRVVFGGASLSDGDRSKADRALELLKLKQRNSRYTSNDYFMLARIYRELGMDEKARQYENMVQPGGQGSPPPGAYSPGTQGRSR